MKTFLRILFSLTVSVGVSACVSSLLGCSVPSSPPESSSSPWPSTPSAYLNVECTAPWAIGTTLNPLARFNVVAVITHTDGSEEYQTPAFDESVSPIRITATCQEGDVVSFLDFTDK